MESTKRLKPLQKLTTIIMVLLIFAFAVVPTIYNAQRITQQSSSGNIAAQTQPSTVPQPTLAASDCGTSCVAAHNQLSMVFHAATALKSPKATTPSYDPSCGGYCGLAAPDCTGYDLCGTLTLSGDASQSTTQVLGTATGYVVDECVATHHGGTNQTCASLSGFSYFFASYIPTSSTIGSPVMMNGVTEFPVTFSFDFGYYYGDNCNYGCFPPPGYGWSFQLAVTQQYSDGWSSDNVYFTMMEAPSVSYQNLGGDGDQVGQCKCGEPIDVGTGNVYETVTDYQTVGINQLSFIRYYNSYAFDQSESVNGQVYALEMGSHWRSNYDSYLSISSTYVIAQRADGQALGFTLNNGVWTSASDIDLKLTQTASKTWTLVDGNNTSETYAVNSYGEGVLSNIAYLDGYQQSISRRSNGTPLLVTDSYGRVLKFSYADPTNPNLVTKVNTPDRAILTYSYSPGAYQGFADRLTSVSYNTSPITSQIYQYNNSSFLYAITGLQDEDGNLYESWTYDSLGRALSSQENGGSNLTSVSYDDTTGNRTVTNALGQQEVFTFSNLQGSEKVTEIDRLATSSVPAATELFRYDSNGYTASATDWKGNLTTYVNDAFGQVTSMTEASGTPLARTTTTTYDATFVHLPDQIVAPDLTTTFTYDSKGNLLTRTTTDTSSTTTNGQTRTWHFTYDATGHVLTTVGPRTDLTQTTTYTYTSNNIATLTDALGHTTTFTSYNGSGQPLSATNPNGVVTTYTYTLRNWLLTVTVHTASNNLLYTLAYDAAGNITQINQPDGNLLYFTYDLAHRVVKISNRLGDRINYTLDALGDITKQQLFPFSGVLASSQTAVYDSLGRTTQQIDAFNQKTRLSYDANGNLISSTDPLLAKTTRTFDALNRPVALTDPLGHKTTYTYDAQDNLLSVTDPRNLVTSYTYDGFGEVLSLNSPDTGVTSYTLDQDGNRVSETDARGIVTTRTFDALDRVLTVVYPASPSENMTYTYDAHSATNFGVGLLTGLVDQSGTTTFTYNERGDLLTDKDTIASKSYTTTYSYDLADNVSKIIYPSGDSVSYLRDLASRINSAIYTPTGGGASTTIVGNITYDPFGPVTSMQYGNGLTSTFTYNQNYLLTKLVTSGTASVQNLTIAYNAANYVSSLSDSLDSTRNQTFTYDAAYHLTQATGQYGTISYAYDADGNRTSMTAGSATTAYSYHSTNNLLLSGTTGSASCKYSYTANGDVATDTCGTTKTTLTYDNNNRNTQILVTATGKSTVTGSYSYNALNERVLKTVGSQRTAYTYDQNGNLLAESNGSTGAMSQEYIWLNNTPVAEIAPGGTIYYIHDDQQGTPQKMTNAAQTVVWDLIQDPFGNTVSLTGTATNNLRFPGQYFDGETGFNYNLNRTFDPTTDRYMQADPIGLAGGIDPYVYVTGDPLNATDPQGLYGEYLCGKIGYCSPEYSTPPPPISLSPELNESLYNFFDNLSTYSDVAAVDAAYFGFEPQALTFAGISMCATLVKQSLRPNPGEVIQDMMVDVGMDKAHLSPLAPFVKKILNYINDLLK